MVQRRSKQGRSPRITVTLNEEDYAWIQSLNEGVPVPHSESYLVARVVHAAKQAGMKLEDATTGASLSDFRDWLKRQRKKDKFAEQLQEWISNFLDQ